MITNVFVWAGVLFIGYILGDRSASSSKNSLIVEKQVEISMLEKTNTLLAAEITKLKEQNEQKNYKKLEFNTIEKIALEFMKNNLNKLQGQKIAVEEIQYYFTQQFKENNTLTSKDCIEWLAKYHDEVKPYYDRIISLYEYIDDYDEIELFQNKRIENPIEFVKSILCEVFEAIILDAYIFKYPENIVHFTELEIEYLRKYIEHTEKRAEVKE